LSRHSIGLLCGLIAFLMWGALPVFWKQLASIPSSTIIAHRIVWSVAILLPVLWFRKRLGYAFNQLKTSKSILLHTLTGALLAGNWLIYVWATNNDKVIEVSLGYYILPLIYIIIGFTFLHESVTKVQWIAIAIASLGVLAQAKGIGSVPWCALGVAFSFAIYGVLKKKAQSDGMAALFLETLMMAPLSLITLIWFAKAPDTPSILGDASSYTVSMIILTGPATIAPLLFFSSAAKRIPLSTIGMLQFIAPSGQFLTGWLYYGEPLNQLQIISFTLIWVSVILYAYSSLSSKKRSEQGK